MFGLHHPNRSLPVARVALEEHPVDTIDLTSGDADGFRVRTLPMDDRDRVGVSRQLVPATAPRQRRRASDGRGLSDLGLPEHLSPPDGGLFPLLTLLESLPTARLPALREQDHVAVVTLGDDPRCGTTPDLVVDMLDEAGHPLAAEQVHVVPWALGDDRRQSRRAADELVGRIDDLRARLVLLRTTPDCPPTIAYAACRRLPAAQLDLCDVQVSRRPAAPLGWGSPIAFVDGRRACSALIAAVLADHLAGGVR